MSYVVKTDGSYREVTNLGWLLNHWKDVASFEVLTGTALNIGGFQMPDTDRDRLGQWDATLVAHLRDGRRYVTRFASHRVLLDWLQRPVFKTVPLTWFGLETKVPG
jgi:hypothetical protein